MNRVSLRFALLALLVAALAACNTLTPPPPAGFTVTGIEFKDVYGKATPQTATYPVPSIRATFSDPVDTASLSGQTVTMADAAGQPVPLDVNGSAFPNSATAAPRTVLKNNATYRITFSAGIKTQGGAALSPATYTFTVRAQPLPATQFVTSVLPGVPVANPTALWFGADRRLYISQIDGTIKIATIATDSTSGAKSVTSVQTVITMKGRSITGLTVRQKASVAELWVSSADPNYTAHSPTDAYGSKVTVLTGPNFAAAHDVVTGIPRSGELHQIEGIAFGPDGRLYINVGGMTNYGAPSANFGNRCEKLFSGAILVADVDTILGASGAGAIDVQPTAEPLDSLSECAEIRSRVGTYPIDQANYRIDQGVLTNALPVKAYATGMRNPYDLIWTRAGKLYATDNGGNPSFGLTPGPADGCPSGNPTDPGTSPDKLNLVLPGHFYGSPNPARYVAPGQSLTARDECTLNGGPDYTAFVLNAGDNLSADGITEYTFPAGAGGLLPGDLLYVSFAAGKALYFYRPSSGEHGVVNQPVGNALGVAVDPADGTIYVAEFGNNPTTPEKGNPVILYIQAKPIP